MGYKHDPKERSYEFVSKAYDLYLKKLYKGKESIKSVKVTTKEVPAGKTIEELTSLGFIPKPGYSDIDVPYDPNASSRGLDPVEQPESSDRRVSAPPAPPAPPLQPPPLSPPALEPPPQALGPSIAPTIAPPPTPQQPARRAPKEEPPKQERITESAQEPTVKTAKVLLHFFDDLKNKDISRKELYAFNLRKIADVLLSYTRERGVTNFLTGYTKFLSETPMDKRKLLRPLIYTSRSSVFKSEICAFKQIVSLNFSAPTSIGLKYRFHENYSEAKYNDINNLELRLSELVFILSNKLLQKTIIDSFTTANDNGNVSHLGSIITALNIRFKTDEDARSGTVAYVHPSRKSMYYDLFDFWSPTYEGNEDYELFKGTVRHECFHLTHSDTLLNVKEANIGIGGINPISYYMKILFEGITVFTTSDHLDDFEKLIARAEREGAQGEAAKKAYYDLQVDRAFYNLANSSRTLSFSYAAGCAFWIWFWKRWTASNPSANFLKDVTIPIYNTVTNPDQSSVESSMTLLAKMVNVPLATPIENGTKQLNYANAANALRDAFKAEAESIFKDFVANMNAKQDYAALGSSFFSTPARPIEHSGYRDPRDYLPNYDVMIEDDLFFGSNLNEDFDHRPILQNYHQRITKQNISQIVFIAMDSFGDNFVENIKGFCSLNSNNGVPINYYIILFSTVEDNPGAPKLPFWDFEDAEQDFISIDEKHILYARIKYESKELVNYDVENDTTAPHVLLEKVLTKIPTQVANDPGSVELAKGNLLITQSIAYT